jgi:hypothetical protein
VNRIASLLKPGSRLVNLSSAGHRYADVDLEDPNFERTPYMAGDDPEMLMSDLQNHFPNDALEIIGKDDAELVARVVDSIERPDAAFKLPIDIMSSNGMQ